MQQSQLGFVTAAIQAGVAIIGALSGKKKAEKQAQAAEYQASMDAIAAGEAVAAPSLMTAEDIAGLKRAWPQIRTVAYFPLIDWSRFGFKPSAPALAALGAVWDQVRGAANFSDVNWNYHAVPIQKVAAVLPVPELPTYMQPAPQGTTLIDPRTGRPIQAGPYQAGLLPGNIPPEYLAAGFGAALLIILLQRR